MLRRMAWKFGLALPVAALALVGFSTITVAQDKKDDAKGKDIVETAMAADNCKTLVKLLDQAELTKVLKEKGPFTVFAPSDEAFKKAGIDDLTKPENKAKLAEVLKYHVVSGKHMAADLKDGQMLKTLNGAEIKVSVKDKKVMVDKADVSKADVAASNGVIHMVDAVLMPAAKAEKHEPKKEEPKKEEPKDNKKPEAPKTGGGH